MNEALGQLGLTPDDVATMVSVGASDDGRLHILLPEQFNPQIVAALLAVFGASVLDVAADARKAAGEAEKITRRLTFKALDPDRPH